MLSFFKKSAVSDYFPLKVDMHSHILPGLDDGSPDVATSIELVKGLMSLGVRHSIATPHIISDLYRNSRETIMAARDLLRNELARQGMEYRIDAAAEYMLDTGFFDLLDHGTPLLTLRDNLLLTEFSWMSMPDNPKELSFRIITGGYTPVLAHPERYGYFHDNFKAYHLLQDLGFKLQVNLLSLSGHYGAQAARAAKYLLKNDMVSFIGTDLHHDRHLAGLRDSRQQMEQLLGGREWNGALLIK